MEFEIFWAECVFAREFKAILYRNDILKAKNSQKFAFGGESYVLCAIIVFCDKEGAMKVSKISVAVLLGLCGGVLCAAEPCGNSDSYIDQLCKRKQGSLSGQSSGGGTKMPSTQLVPDFEIQPFAEDPKAKSSPFKQ